MKTVFYSPAQAFLCYHYFSGAKPTHVYLHGLGISSTGMYPSLLYASNLASYHTIMPDFLGFGYSDRPFEFSYTIDEHTASIACLLDQLQVTDCTVIGASMGGAVAITLATQRPDLVARLVLAEGVLDGFNVLDVFGAASQTEEQYITSGHGIVMEQFRQWSLSYNLTDRGWLQSIKLIPPFAFYRTAASLAKDAQPSWREQFYQLKIPRMYIWGDENYQDQSLEQFSNHGIQVAVIPHAGHIMMWDNTVAFIDAITEFSAR